MYLFIDTSQKGQVNLSLYSEKKKEGELIKEGDFRLTEKLLFLIDQFLDNHNLQLTDLKGMLVVLGPGAFTSLRITVVLVNTIAQFFKIPIYGDCKQAFTSDEKIFQACKEIKLNLFLKPFYGKDPNITLVKK